MLDVPRGRGRSVKTILVISLEEGAMGGSKTIQVRRLVGCELCGASWSGEPRACARCGGSRVVGVEERVRVAWPAGVASGSKFLCPGAGDAVEPQQPPGDLVVEVQIRAHSFLRRVGNDCHLELPLCFSQATLGCMLRIPSLYGQITLAVPPGTQCHSNIVVPGEGFPVLKEPNAPGPVRGNLVVRVLVQVPHAVSPEDAELLRRFDRNVKQKSM